MMDGTQSDLSDQEKLRPDDERIRWRSRRDRYREKRDKTVRRPFKHYEELMFLLPTLQGGEGYIDPSESEDDEVSWDSQSSSDNEYSDVSYETADHASQSNDVQPPTTRPTNQRPPNREQQVLYTPLERVALQFLRHMSNQDVCDHFGRLVAGLCRSLSPEKRNTFMAFVMWSRHLFSGIQTLPPLDVLLSTIREAIMPFTQPDDPPNPQQQADSQTAEAAMPTSSCRSKYCSGRGCCQPI
ncbi:uncharacterized protein [Engystomops pustulosus]|uniref:uncharacterized protein n=1 Tax=Engystomops pustulosus TaxID=76066 RepID=UPI003AFA393A